MKGWITIFHDLDQEDSAISKLTYDEGDDHVEIIIGFYNGAELSVRWNGIEDLETPYMTAAALMQRLNKDHPALVRRRGNVLQGCRLLVRGIPGARCLFS